VKNMDKATFVETDPICPYCEKTISSLNAHYKKGMLTGSDVGAYSCPHCKKIIGVTNITWGNK
jgi:ssDNA-binding Zn-finger/Zn-ribbon topoisomerase 1